MLSRLLFVFSLVCLLVQVAVSNSNLKSTPLRKRINHSATALLKTDFDGFQAELLAAQEPIRRDCQAKKSHQVVATFIKLHKSFQKLASDCSKTYNRNKDSASYLAPNFIKVLLQYQPLLMTVKAHPAILNDCSHIFRSTSTSINAMISFLKAGKIDIASEARKHGAELNMNLFSQCAFNINKFS